MIKALVETVGPHMYLDGSQELKHNRPTLVEVTPYVSTLIAQQKIILLVPNFPDKANDVDFVQVLKDADGDVELAAATYASMCGIDESGRPAVTE